MSKPLSDAIVEIGHVLTDLAGYLDRVRDYSILSTTEVKMASEVSEKIRDLAIELGNQAANINLLEHDNQPEVRST